MSDTISLRYPSSYELLIARIFKDAVSGRVDFNSKFTVMLDRLTTLRVARFNAILGSRTINPTIHTFNNKSLETSNILYNTVIRYLNNKSVWITEEINNGLTSKDAIRKVDKFISKRSKFIARNEIGNLISTIDNDLASVAGIKEYYWRSSEDERVRGNPSGKYPKAKPDHYARNGFRYSIVKGAGSHDTHPGKGILCRCTAEFIIV